jgi:hypothetical protein
LRFIFALRICEALFSKKNKKSGQNEFGERIIDIGGEVFSERFRERRLIEFNPQSSTA